MSSWASFHRRDIDSPFDIVPSGQTKQTRLEATLLHGIE